METGGNEKLKNVLLKLLDPSFKLKNESYLNSIIDHLKAKPDDSKELKNRMTQEYFILWLKQAVVKWENAKQLPPLSILTFTFNLSTLYTRIEEIFVKLNSENIFERLIKIIFKIISGPNAPGIKIAYIQLLSSFLNHKSGLQWILSTNYWSKVIILTLKCETIYLQKEGSQFLAHLLHKSVSINEIFCNNIIQIILSPLNEVAKQSEIREQAIYQQLCPCLNLIIQTFETLLELSTSSNDYKVFLIFKEKYNLEVIIRTILTKIQNDNFVFELNKILFILSFFDLVYKVGGTCEAIQLDKAMAVSQKVFDVFLDAANRGTVSNFLKLCYIGHIYWRNIDSKMPACMSPDRVKLLFEDQLLLLQLYPAVMISFKMVGNNLDDLEAEDACREDLANTLCKNVIPETFRTAFKWRTYLQNNFSFDHATLALKYVLHSKKFYSKSLANTAFRILIHSLRDINKILKEQPGQITVLAQEANYMCLLIETVGVLIKEFDLKWQDSVETICVMEIIFKFLSFPVWPTKLVVKGLSLLEISIANRMSPMQALLLDSPKDSTFNLVTTMLYAKLHDSSWEVRDTAMDVVRTICRPANKEFSSFKTLVLDADLPSLTLKMATGDGERFVRASAFKCLQEMVETNEFWEEITKSENALNQIITVVHEETEGIVRCEIATLISQIYTHQAVSDEILEQFYSVMSHAVIVDLHWEVKIRALDFWCKVIDKHLTNQGMIDGSFPSITFSKEQKKILTLSEQEVKISLIKVLHQLCEIGCLGVFISALQDDCDVEVAKAAMKFLKNFVSLLKQYNVTILDVDNCPLTPPSSLGNNHNSPASSSSTGPEDPTASRDSNLRTATVSRTPVNNSNQDTVIDDILNSQDLNLLESVFNALGEPTTNAVEIKNKKITSPYEFLHYVLDELEKKMKNKHQWLKDLDNFDSLLDDILSEYNGDINNMDCY